jgi:hypothetical protein
VDSISCKKKGVNAGKSQHKSTVSRLVLCHHNSEKLAKSVLKLCTVACTV